MIQRSIAIRRSDELLLHQPYQLIALIFSDLRLSDICLMNQIGIHADGMIIEKTRKNLCLSFTVRAKKLFEFTLSKHDDLCKLFAIEAKNICYSLIDTSAVLRCRLIITQQLCIKFRCCITFL